MSAPQFLPWQLETARNWLGNRERFAHAWLVHGLAGIGKLDFAVAAAASLLCETPQDGLACGHCAACAWFASGNHPDLRRIRPEAIAVEEGAEAAEQAEDAEPVAGSASKRAPSKEIRIDQIRALESWFNTATHRGGWRVALLYPAHALNVVSANALLKVLEEPPPHTVFLLVADAPDRLLPTLVSRCRRLPRRPMPTPRCNGCASRTSNPPANGWRPAAARRWRGAERRGRLSPWLGQLVAPLAQGQSPDVGTLAEALEKVPATDWIDALQRFYTDLMLAAAGAVRYFPRWARRGVAARARPARVAEAARWLTPSARWPRTLNAKLFAHSALQRVVLSCLA